MNLNICYQCTNTIKGKFCSKCGFSNDSYVVPAHHLTPGILLRDRYLVGKCIGEGGFGITYVGRDIVLNLKVAIKEFFPVGHVTRNNTSSLELTPITGQNDEYYTEAKDKFLSEARVLAKFINEEGIVGVRDYFEESNTAYIIMDYVEGKTLKKYVQDNGHFQSEDLIARVVPLLKSLGKIHQENIVHRDISPDNILITPEGRLVLLDFGAAREVIADNSKSLSIILKPGYAPEEQYRKKGKQGPWTDIYALCATMYYCISGIVPEDSMERLFDDDVKPLKDVVPNCSPRISDIIMTGMSVSKEKRYQNVYQLMDALNSDNGINEQSQGRDDLINDEKEQGYTIRFDDAKTPGSTSRTKDSSNSYDGKVQSGNGNESGKRMLVPIIVACAAVTIVVALIMIITGKKTESVENEKISQLEGAQSELTQSEEVQTEATLSEEIQQEETQSEELQSEVTDTESSDNDEEQAVENVKPEEPDSDSSVQYEDTENEVEENTDNQYAEEVYEDEQYEETDSDIDYPTGEKIPVTYATATTYLHDTASDGQTYEPEKLIDNDHRTAWIDGAKGDGIGESVQLEFGMERKVSKLVIYNGFLNSCYRYTLNGKLTRALIEFSDGTSFEANIDVMDGLGMEKTPIAEEDMSPTTIVLDEPVKASWVKLTILDIVRPLKWHDTAISEIEVY